MTAERDRRLAEEKAVAQAQARKTKRIAIIATPLVVVVIVAAVMIPNFIKAQQEEAARLEAYNAAVALAEAGRYDEAIVAFAELGDYEDSMEQVNATTYNQAVALFEAGEYNKAVSIFTELGSYKDSSEQIVNVQNQQLEEQYQAAFSLIENENFQKAYDEFMELGDYKNSKDIAQQLLDESDALFKAMYAFQGGNLDSALSIIENKQQYINFSPEEESIIKFLSRYVGKWEYLSGDATALTKSSDRDKSYSESYSIEAKFEIVDGTPYMLMYYDSRNYERFQVDFENQELKMQRNSGSNLSAELTAQDTLQIKHTYVSYASGKAELAILTCEYTMAG